MDSPAARLRKRDAARLWFTPARIMAAVWAVLAVLFFSVIVRFSKAHRRSALDFTHGLARWWKTGRFAGSFRAGVSLKARQRALRLEYEAQYDDMAIITMATGDAAAKHAVALIQAFRDYKTVVPRIIVLLSRGGMGSDDCHNETLRHRRGRHYHCTSQYAEPDDIVSQGYLDAFARLGAETRVIDQIPNTEYTTMIPGGRASFWGMSFNKLRIFAMTEFKKILFVDADIMIFGNVDHILLEPDFTAAFTTECCNGGARGKLGGGMWVFEPSMARWNYTQLLIKQPCPDSDLGTWVHADMDVVNYMFCDIREGFSFESWPFTRDLRQGALPGLRNIPQYRDISTGDYNNLVSFPSSGLPAPEGLLPVHANKRGIWHILDTRYDSLVGNCECLGHRDMWDNALSVHFSCMQVFSKPGHFQTDWDFWNALYTRGGSCSRYYYSAWYAKFVKGNGGPLKGPLWDGLPVPTWNKTHDALVDQWRREREAREAAEERAREAIERARLGGEK